MAVLGGASVGDFAIVTPFFYHFGAVLGGWDWVVFWGRWDGVGRCWLGGAPAPP